MIAVQIMESLHDPSNFLCAYLYRASRNSKDTINKYNQQINACKPVLTDEIILIQLYAAQLNSTAIWVGQIYSPAVS